MITLKIAKIKKIAKKFIFTALSLSLLLVVAKPALATSITEVASITETVAVDLDVTFNGSYLRFGVPLQVDTISNRTLVPIRPIFEAFGVPADNIMWDEDQEMLIVERPNGSNMYFIMNYDYILEGNDYKWTDTPARMIDDWVYIPLRFVAEAFGAEVIWIESENLIELILE